MARCAVLEGAAMNDAYYDGAGDALAEAIREVKAAFVMGDALIKPQDYPTREEYYAALVEKAIDDLALSYASDQRFMREYEARKAAGA